MKKVFFILLLVFAGEPLFSQDNTQLSAKPENYFDEAIQLRELDIILKVVDSTIKRKIEITSDGEVKWKKDSSLPLITDSLEAILISPPQGDAYGQVRATNHLDILVIEEKVKEELMYAVALLYRFDDPFFSKIKTFPKKFLYLSVIMETLKKNNTKKVGNSGSALFPLGLSQEQIIYGIVDFAVKRAKEELMEAHVQQLYTQLKTNDIISPLIPNALRTTKAFIDERSVSLSKYGDLWKASFEEDLRNTPLVFQDEVYVRKICNNLQLDSTLSREMIPVITGADYIVYNLYLKKHFSEVLGDLSARYESDKEPYVPYFKRTVLLSNIITSACGGMVDNRYKLVTVEKIKTMKPEAWLHLTRLIFIRHQDALQKAVGAKTEVFRKWTTDKLPELINIVNESVSIQTSIQKILFTENPVQADKKISFEEIRELYHLQFRLIDNSLQYVNWVDPGAAANFKGRYDTCIRPFINPVSEIGEGVSSKQYGKVLDGCLSIFNNLQRFCKTKDEEKTLLKTISLLTKYGSFMVNILSAKEGKDVEAALDEFIPRGQYRLKTDRRFSVTASLYPGAIYGREWITKYQVSGNTINKGQKNSSPENALGFYLPIGIDLNWGLKWNDTKNWGISLFLQAFDLGAVMNYRMTNDSTETSNPEISWKQLLSPGASVLLHFPNSPVTLGTGVTYTPSLRKIEVGNTSYTANALRWGIFIAVDVTAFPLFSSPRK